MNTTLHNDGTKKDTLPARLRQCAHYTLFVLSICGHLFVKGWDDVLNSISPYTYAYLGLAFGLASCVVGAAWYVVP